METQEDTAKVLETSGDTETLWKTQRVTKTHGDSVRLRKAQENSGGPMET